MPLKIHSSEKLSSALEVWQKPSVHSSWRRATDSRIASGEDYYRGDSYRKLKSVKDFAAKYWQLQQSNLKVSFKRQKAVERK